MIGMPENDIRFRNISSIRGPNRFDILFFIFKMKKLKKMLMVLRIGHLESDNSSQRSSREKRY